MTKEDEELIAALVSAAEDDRLDDGRRELLANAGERLEETLEEIDDMQGEIDGYESEEPDELFANSLYDAIVERRREDAVELLGKMFNMNFPSIGQHDRIVREREKA